MIETLEKIYSFLRFPLPYSFGLAFLGFVLMLFSNFLKSLKKNPRKIRIIGGVLFGQLIILGIALVLLQVTILRKIRNEFIEIIKNPQTQIIQIDKNFGEFNSVELKNELLKIKNYEPHHSGINEEMKLRIKNPENSFIVRICRDTQYENEYWIFSEKYWFSSDDEEIGRIKTNKFK